MDANPISGDCTDPRFELAEQLAASCHYREALALIDQLEPCDVPLLLLKGKILAQQRRLSSAIQTWQQVLRTDPDNSAALAAIRRAQLASRRLVGWFYYFSLGAWGAWLAGAAVVALVVVGCIRFSQAFYFAQQTTTPAAQDENDQLIEQRMQRMETALADLEQRVAEPASSSAQAPPAAQQVDLHTVTQTLSSHRQEMDQLQLELMKVQSDALALNETVQAMTDKLRHRDDEESAQQLANFGAKLNALRNDLLLSQRDQVGWQIDALIHRHRSLPQAERAARQELVTTVELLVAKLETMSFNSTWQNYVTEVRTWIEKERTE